MLKHRTLVTLASLVLTLLLVAGSSLAQAPEPGAVQQTLAGNAFTYQGYLTDGGSPANGPYDFVFSLYADSAGTQWVTDAAPLDNVQVVDGLFTVLVDVTDGMYGDVYFYLNGDARWLKIGVRPGASVGRYTYLSPLQPLTPTPYALALPGLNTVQNDTSANVIGGYSWNYVDPNAVGAAIGGGGADGERNQVLHNYGTVSGGLDNTADGNGATIGGGAYHDANSDMATIAGGQQNSASGYAAAIGGGQWNTTTGAYTAIGGGAGNTAGAAFSTIGGGGWTTPADPNTSNHVTDEYGTVSGGGNNRAGNNDGDQTNARYATVGGGRLNIAAGDEAAVCGGSSNSAGGANATVGGGEGNTASQACAAVAGGCGNVAANVSATVGGGEVNYANASSSTVSGGSGNTADGQYATVPGGRSNYAGANYSFAAGRRAKAYHQGSFVWADSTDADFASTTSNQFLVRATGGAEIYANTSIDALYVENQHNLGDGIHILAEVSNGNNYAALWAWNSGTSPAVYANTAGTYSGYFYDDIWVDGTCVSCALAYVALNGGDVPLETGDLVTAGGVEGPLLGATDPVIRVQRAAAGNAGAVVGVVTARAVLVDSERDGQRSQSAEIAEGPAAPGDYLFIVVQGLAQVKADASQGAIAVGQRLAAAEQPGHARLLETRTLDGMVVSEGAATIGLALAPLETGSGLIPVLVNLR